MITELKCKHCDRYLGKAFGTIIAEIRCSNSSCKAGNQFKIINADTTSDIRHKFIDPPQPPKTKDTELKNATSTGDAQTIINASKEVEVS